MRILTLILAFLVIVSTANAGQYIGVGFGTNDKRLTNESHNPKIGFKADAVYGYRYENQIRTELTASFSKNEFKTVHHMKDIDVLASKEYRSFHSWTYMANVLFDLNQLSIHTLTPYVGVGVGYCESTEKNKIKFADKTYKDMDRDGRISYQAIVGLSHAIDNFYTAALEYKYNIGQSHAKNHSFGLSLLRSF